jgi:hypothetical protein
MKKCLISRGPRLLDCGNFWSSYRTGEVGESFLLALERNAGLKTLFTSSGIALSLFIIYEAFPKLQFWESNLEIRGFARLKA